jgi:uncharacterized membrane-anchored protein
MKTLRIAIFIVVALLQLSVPASVVWKRERTLKHGRVWKFRTAPADPIDAIRGRYVRLRFAAEEVPAQAREQRISPNSSVWVSLKEDADGFARIDRVSETALSGDNIVTAEAGYWTDRSSQVHFPFDRFWVTEKNAPAAEKAYLENSRHGKQNAYATVRVREGDATIEQLYIEGQPLADYLRAHPQK